MLQIQDLNLTLPGGRRLFEDLTLKVDTGMRLGLVGANGVGKTTLLRTIVGQVQPDSGSIIISPSYQKVGYLPQDLVELPSVILMEYLKDRTGISEAEQNLRRLTDDLANAPENERPRLMNLHDQAQSHFETIDGYAFEALARKTLKGLGFNDGDDRRICSEFSGGWKMRITLAGLLLAHPDLMLLDEPTNHLDTESMEWLEGWLSGYTGTLVAISHDRIFMDKILKDIAELHMGKVHLYRGNFSSYELAKSEQDEQQRQAAEKQKDEIARTKEFIERFRYKATKAAQVQSRIKTLEKTHIITVENDAKHVHMRFSSCTPSGLIALRVNDLSKSYGDHCVFSGVNFEIQRGQKVALVGVNGAGKSTLSRIIAGIEEPTSGTCELGYHVVLAYFSQQSSENLNYSHTVWEEINPLDPNMSETAKRTLLGSFLFSGDDINKSVNVLSGGEKSRLSLAKILMKSSNMLVLDEPTNHLDMDTRALFQEALLAYDGTLLIVSHDRYFLNQLAGRVLEIRNGKLHDYAGNYSAFISSREKQLAAEAALQTDEVPQRNAAKERRREEAERRIQTYRRKKSFVEEGQKLETEIAQMESRKTEIEKLLCSPEVLSNSAKVQSLMKELGDLTPSLEQAMNRWETIMETVEEIEREGRPQD